jgi:hypothetical protein
VDRAAIPEHHDPADQRIDRRDPQRELHLVLADDRGEGKARHMSNTLDIMGVRTSEIA